MYTFSMRAKIWVNHKIASQVSEPIFNKFYIKPADETIQSLNWALDQIIIINLWFFSKSSYSFKLLIFGVLPKM